MKECNVNVFYIKSMSYTQILQMKLTDKWHIADVLFSMQYTLPLLYISVLYFI